MDPNAKKNIDETNIYIRDTLLSVGAKFAETLRDAVDDAFASADSSVLNTVGKDLTKTFNRLVKLSDDYALNQSRINAGILKSKDVQKQIQQIAEKRDELERKILHAQQLKVKINLEDVQATKESLNVQEAQLRNDLARTDEIEKRLGLTGKLASSLSNVPGLGKFIKGKELEQELSKVAAAGGGTLKQLGAAAEHIGTNMKAAFGPAFLLYLAQAGLKADEQTTKLAKSLSQTKFEAAQTRDNFAAMARESGDNFITTEKLVESTLKLGKQLGIASTFSADLTKEFTTLTGKIGLSEEAAGGLAKLTIANGKNARAVTAETLGATQALQSQYGIGLDNRQILEETGKVSGQLLANFQGNPAAIAKAVAQAKLLGTTLEQTKKQSESLLDFQSSIENELKAEVITGQQLNLERARAAALAGDQETVAKELSAQNMNFSKFSRMNVLAQKDFAAALGLSADELSDQLLTQQYLGKSRKEVAALEGEAVAKRLEQQSAQDKFNQAVEKLQDIFVSLIDGPIGQLLNLLVDMLDVVGLIGKAFSEMIPAPLLKILAGVGTGAAVGAAFGGIGALPGAIAGGLLAAGGVAMNAQDDMISGYGERTLITPKGSYALNNQDTVIAGTNLFRGNDVYSGPKGAINLGGGEIDYDKLAASMSKVQIVTDVTDVVNKTNSKMAMSHLANKRYSS
jgi:hypothetical protein